MLGLILKSPKSYFLVVLSFSVKKKIIRNASKTHIFVYFFSSLSAKLFDLNSHCHMSRFYSRDRI